MACDPGFSVVAVDAWKARRLAAERKVSIDTVVEDPARHCHAPASFDAVIAIFAHLPAAIRPAVHAAAEAVLVPGGVVIVEAFTPRQPGARTREEAPRTVNGGSKGRRQLRSPAGTGGRSLEAM